MFEPFSLRRRRQVREESPVLYGYDVLPEPFRVQVIHTLDGVFGVREARGNGVISMTGYGDTPEDIWLIIEEAMSRHLGVFQLSGTVHSHRNGYAEYLLNASRSVDQVLDAIEYAFQMVSFLDEHSVSLASGYRIRLTPAEAVEELNYRFGQHDLGYRMVDYLIVRIDSEYLHIEVIEPALKLLHEEGFEVARDAFAKAHKHYRHGELRDAIRGASDAFESTLKAICDAEEWGRAPSDSAATLVDITIRNGLLPKELESHYKGLISSMKSGLPTVANPYRHGPAPTPSVIPPYLASHALNLAAANIVFLVESWKALPR